MFNRVIHLKPEVAQNGYYTSPVNFSAWSNVVKSLRVKCPEVVEDKHAPFPSAADIINMFLDDRRQILSRNVHPLSFNVGRHAKITTFMAKINNAAQTYYC